MTPLAAPEHLGPEHCGPEHLAPEHLGPEHLAPGELRLFAETGYLVREHQIPEADCDNLTLALSDHIHKTATDYLAGLRQERPFFELLASSAASAEVFFNVSEGPLRNLPAAEWERKAMRIGHGLHEELPVFKNFAHRPEISVPLSSLTDLALRLTSGSEASPDVAGPSALGNEPSEKGLSQGPPRATSAAPQRDARFIQSAIIYKQPRDNVVQFGFHRDSAYLPNEPESLVLAFVALDAMTPENGCLEVIPRSHLEPLQMLLTLTPDGFVPSGREPKPDSSRAVLLPMARGTVAFVHGRTLHASAPNRSAAPRRALIVHAMSPLSTLSPLSWANH